MKEETKYRIVRHSLRDTQSAEIRHVFRVQKLNKGVSFWRKIPWQEWVNCTYRAGYGDYSWNESFEFKTEAEARKWIKRKLVKVPEDKIIDYP